MNADWRDPEVADGHLRAALTTARETIEEDARRLVDLREEDLRRAIFSVLWGRLPRLVRKEETLALEAFRGVGGFDLLVGRSPGGAVAWLGEVKWSYTKRTKIFEAIWDGVKLCLAAAEYGAARCWLITGAPNSQWRSAECRELFLAGTVPFETLWNQELDPPGPNGGKSVGADLLAGGRGNRFTRAPRRFAIEAVAEHDLRPDREDWSIRAVAVTAEGGWIEEFAPPPVFPRRITQPWLDQNVPDMEGEQSAELVEWLRHKRWTDADLAERVYPLRRS